MSERHSGASPSAGSADCKDCRHRALLAEGKCQPGDVCVVAQSGRLIDRFLRRNPQFAQDYLHDDFWERRAIAVRHAPLESLRQIPRDVDEVVRRVMVSRLPKDELDGYVRDPDRDTPASAGIRSSGRGELWRATCCCCVAPARAHRG